jgi:hypothetical protein
MQLCSVQIPRVSTVRSIVINACGLFGNVLIRLPFIELVTGDTGVMHLAFERLMQRIDGLTPPLTRGEIGEANGGDLNHALR